MKVAPEDRAVSESMQALADALHGLLEEIAGKPMGFSLIVFNAEPGSRLNYVSNCDRQEVMNAMKSLLAGWEGGMPDIPAHEIQG
ncbi:MAG: hypothetical protein Hals2KO_21830 [Halioglobus sp.]